MVSHICSCTIICRVFYRFYENWSDNNNNGAIYHGTQCKLMWLAYRKMAIALSWASLKSAVRHGLNSVCPDVRVVVLFFLYSGSDHQPCISKINYFREMNNCFAVGCCFDANMSSLRSGLVENCVSVCICILIRKVCPFDVRTKAGIHTAVGWCVQFGFGCQIICNYRWMLRNSFNCDSVVIGF